MGWSFPVTSLLESVLIFPWYVTFWPWEEGECLINNTIVLVIVKMVYQIFHGWLPLVEKKKFYHEGSLVTSYNSCSVLLCSTIICDISILKFLFFTLVFRVFTTVVNGIGPSFSPNRSPSITPPYLTEVSTAFLHFLLLYIEEEDFFY